MERRRQEHDPSEYRALRRGWFYGDEEFRQELLAQMAEKVGPSHSGAERQESGQERAERIVREEMKRLGWREKALEERRKGDAGKVRMARRLRAETTLGLKEIAARLRMGSWSYVANLLGNGRAGKKEGA